MPASATAKRHCQLGGFPPMHTATSHTQPAWPGPRACFGALMYIARSVPARPRAAFRQLAAFKLTLVPCGVLLVPGSESSTFLASGWADRRLGLHMPLLIVILVWWILIEIALIGSTT